MSFTLELTAGGIKAVYCSTIPHPKPFLQIIRLHKIESSHINSERYKVLLSDGLAYMQGVLTPKLNHLIYLKNVSNFSVVKLIEYEVHEIKGVKYVIAYTSIRSNFLYQAYGDFEHGGHNYLT